MTKRYRLPHFAAAALAACVAFAAAPALADGGHYDHDRGSGHVNRDRGHYERGDRGHYERGDRGHYERGDRDHRDRGYWDRDDHRRAWRGERRDDGDDHALGALFGALSVALAPPRPAYVALPRVVYAPPPPRIAYYGPYGTVSAAPASPVYQTAEGRYCREYQATVRVNGVPRPSYGTACLEPDGAWHIMN